MKLPSQNTIHKQGCVPPVSLKMANPFPDELLPAEVAEVRQLLAERNAAQEVADPPVPADANQAAQDPPAIRAEAQVAPNPPAAPPAHRPIAHNHPELRRWRSRSRSGPRRPNEDAALQRSLRRVSAYCLRCGRSNIRPSFDSLDGNFHSWRDKRDIIRWMQGQIRQNITTDEIGNWLEGDVAHIGVSGNYICMRRKRQ